MENKNAKRSKKPLYLILSFFGIFGLFVYMITIPSTYEMAANQLEISYNVEQVRKCWDQYKSELSNDEDFLTQLRNRLESFDLSESEIVKCKQWLPPTPVSINLIVVPDLSKRIVDIGNNPDQVFNDSILLAEVWTQFKKITRPKMNSKDRLIVDVTDDGQADGQFRTLADELVFDLSTHTGQGNVLYFNKVAESFNNNIKKLYNLAKHNPIGADYWYYFNRSLKKKLLKSNFNTEYRNLLIIITDGYLEAQNTQRTGTSFYTGNYAQRFLACSQLKKGASFNNAMIRSELAIRDCQEHFPELEVLILEVNERSRRTPQEPFDPGTSCDYDMLRYMWKDWFKLLEIKNSDKEFFIQRNHAIELTKGEIEKFLIK